MTTTPPVKKACDACHRRKVRCSGGQPCRNCGQASLQCTYLAVPQKKGPKGSRAKVISEIRDTQQQQQHKQISSPTESHYANQKNGPDSNSFDFNSPPDSPYTSRSSSLLPQKTIDRCVEFFANHLYPTIPILSHKHLIELTKPENKHLESPPVYCLISSLCAFVMVQPGMNFPVSLNGIPKAESPQGRHGLAHALIEDCLRVRKSFDYVEDPSVLSVQTSFFLFGCYFCLEKQNTCWFHLREAATLALIMSMHDETSYLTGDPTENMYKRRTYWLLLVTERAYAMERHRPLSLYATIELPSAEGPHEEEFIAGFLCLISLFRCIDDEFMGLWNKSRTECSTAWLAQLQQQLVDALPSDLKTTEVQAADIRTTQQWLRVMVWQLSIANGYLSSTAPHSSMTFKYPIEVARDLIQDLKSLSLDSMEVHGVGLIEKLFDVACTLTDVIACVPLEPSKPGTGQEDRPDYYLHEFVNLISRLRGGSSRYLPLLWAKVSEISPNMTTMPLQSMPMTIKQGYAGAADGLPTPSQMPHHHTSTSNSRPHLPLAPYPSVIIPSYHDQGLMFDSYSPSTSTYGSDSAISPLATPQGFISGQQQANHILSSAPRSVPTDGVKFERYPG